MTLPGAGGTSLIMPPRGGDCGGSLHGGGTLTPLGPIGMGLALGAIMAQSVSENELDPICTEATYVAMTG